MYWFSDKIVHLYKCVPSLLKYRTADSTIWYKPVSCVLFQNTNRTPKISDIDVFTRNLLLKRWYFCNMHLVIWLYIISFELRSHILVRCALVLALLFSTFHELYYFNDVVLYLIHDWSIGMNLHWRCNAAAIKWKYIPCFYKSYKYSWSFIIF